MRSMLTFGRGLQGAPTVCEPNRIVDDCMNLLRHTLSHSIQIKVITNPEVWKVRADEAQLLQSDELSLNARDAMPDGGTLMIETDNYTIDADYCSPRHERAARAVRHDFVGDTGSGIDQEVLPRIFEPFFSTKGAENNFGMGLVSAAGIVKSHTAGSKSDASREDPTSASFCRGWRITARRPNPPAGKPSWWSMTPRASAA